MTDETIETKALEEETKRLCQRYIDEVVLPYSLCPWAAPALQNGSVQMTVITDQFSDISSAGLCAQRVREKLARVEEEERIELVLVLLPRCEYSRLEMDDLLREVRNPQLADTTEESELAFALAAFHPDAEADTSEPERLIPYLRRSPDPMIQGVRTSALKKIQPTRRAGTAYFDLEKMNLDDLKVPAPEPLRTKIAKANLVTYRESGFATFEEHFTSILEDRKQTRRRLDGRKV